LNAAEQAKELEDLLWPQLLVLQRSTTGQDVHLQGQVDHQVSTLHFGLVGQHLKFVQATQTDDEENFHAGGAPSFHVKRWSMLQATLAIQDDSLKKKREEK
jgi:hypothetical protein